MFDTRISSFQPSFKFFPFLPRVTHADSSSCTISVDSSVKFPSLLHSSPSSSLISFPSFLGGLSYAEVVADRVDSRVFWHKSIDFPDNVEGSPCASSVKDAATNQRNIRSPLKHVQGGKPCSLAPVANIRYNVSSSQVVTNQINSRVFWNSSIKFPGNAVSSSSASSVKDAATNRRNIRSPLKHVQVQEGKPCSVANIRYNVSSSQVVTNQTKPRVFSNSIKFPDNAVSSSSASSVEAGAVHRRSTNFRSVEAGAVHRRSTKFRSVEAAAVHRRSTNFRSVEAAAVHRRSTNFRSMEAAAANHRSSTNFMSMEAAAANHRSSTNFSHRQRHVEVNKPCSLTSVSVKCNVSPSLTLNSQTNKSSLPVPAEHGIYNACSRSVRTVIPCVERGFLRVSEKAAVQQFVSNLSFRGSPVGGLKGQRYEWLFSSRSYSYGNRVIQPCGAFSEVEHLCAGVVEDLRLVKPNACLLVFYPRGTSGLRCHKDDEPAHACDQVITLCHGVGAALVLENNSRQEVAREWLEGGDFYVFRDQRSFYHGVDGVESTGNGRWAFTFRVFKPSSETSQSVPTPRSLVSVSVAVAQVPPVRAACFSVRGSGSCASRAACVVCVSPSLPVTSRSLSPSQAEHVHSASHSHSMHTVCSVVERSLLSTSSVSNSVACEVPVLPALSVASRPVSDCISMSFPPAPDVHVPQHSCMTSSVASSSTKRTIIAGVERDKFSVLHSGHDLPSVSPVACSSSSNPVFFLPCLSSPSLFSVTGAPDGLSYAEVVANRVNSRVYHRSSTKFSNSVLSCEFSAEATTVGNTSTNFQSCPSRHIPVQEDITSRKSKLYTAPLLCIACLCSLAPSALTVNVYTGSPKSSQECLQILLSPKHCWKGKMSPVLVFPLAEEE